MFFVALQIDLNNNVPMAYASKKALFLVRFYLCNSFTAFLKPVGI